VEWPVDIRPLVRNPGSTSRPGCAARRGDTPSRPSPNRNRRIRFFRLPAGNEPAMSYDWWTRWDRATCRITGHSWLDHRTEWLGGPAGLRTCIRCGASRTAALHRRQHPVRAA
jgi:hypothetical protein